MNQKRKTDERDTGEDRDYLKGKDLSAEDQVKRPTPPILNEDEDNFRFMQIDVDYYTETNNNVPRKF